MSTNQELVFELFRRQRENGKPETIAALMTLAADALAPITPMELAEIQVAWRHQSDPDAANKANANAILGDQEAAIDALASAKHTLIGVPVKGRAKPKAKRKAKAVPTSAKLDMTALTDDASAQRIRDLELELRLVTEERDNLRFMVASALAQR